MPELPEVETIRRQLDQVLQGKQIAEVEVRREKSFQGGIGDLREKMVEGVERKGKVMAITLSASQLVVLVHLKMTGQLIYQPQGSARIVGGHPTSDWVNALPSKHTRVVITLTDGSTLYFNDQRVFGWMKVVTRSTWYEVRSKMPPDVIDPEFTVDYLYGVLQRSRRPVKLVVMDSQVIGGAGNIYANDALYIARIHPKIPANQVNIDAVKQLHAALVQVIRRGIETGGASYSDYVDTQGMGGKYQEEFMVYDKAGSACRQCGSPIEKIILGGRGTYFCPTCQTEP